MSVPDYDDLARRPLTPRRDLLRTLAERQKALDHLLGRGDPADDHDVARDHDDDVARDHHDDHGPFERFSAILDRYPASFRALVDARAVETAGDWRLLALQARDRAELANGHDDVLDYVPPQRHQLTTRSTWATSTKPGTVAVSAGDDPLKAVPPHVYFEAITGVVVPSNGWVRCPVPDHPDEHPSCQVTSTHWRCWSCGAGGSIIDLAAALWQIEPRGAGFVELRRRIARELLGGIHA